MQLGDIDLHLVSDGTYREDGGRLFGLVPKVLWEQITQPDEHNRLGFNSRCLLIETGQERILVDTGYGDKLSEKQMQFLKLEGSQRLPGDLEGLGVGPLDVDLVINTHLHGDRCGGNTVCAPGGALVPTFPRATYCVQRLELADAHLPNERTRAAYLGENILPIERNNQLRVLWGDTRLTDHVRVIISPGHTRAHQCVVIESGQQVALFLGAAAPWPIHMERLSWVSAHDVEPLASIETKRRLARWALDRRALLIFACHPDVEAGYLHATKRPDRFKLEPVAISG